MKSLCRGASSTQTIKRRNPDFADNREPTTSISRLDWTSSVFVQPPQFTRHHAKRKVKGLFEIEMNPAIYFCVERKDEEGSI